MSKYVSKLLSTTMSRIYCCNNQQVLHRKKDPNAKINCNEEKFVYKEGHNEYWWINLVKTATKVRHNKPDLIIIEWVTSENV